MELPTWLVYSLLLFTVMAFVVSLVSLQVSLFKDEARENRIKRLENETTSLHSIGVVREERLKRLEEEVLSLCSQIEVLRAEGLAKDDKIEAQALQILQMQEQIDDKELQIVELRRQISKGTQ